MNAMDKYHPAAHERCSPGGADSGRTAVIYIYAGMVAACRTPVQRPAAGAWTVEVLANEVNADGHPETPATDADFALVVTTATR